MKLILSAKRNVVALIGVSGIIFGTLRFNVAAFFCIVFLALSSYSNMKLKYEFATAIALIFSAAVFMSTTIYVWGQRLFPLSDFLIRTISFVCLALFCRLTDGGVSRLHRLRIATQSLGATCVFFLFLSISAGRLITFLGLGYDNYSHYYVFRQILIKRQAIFGTNNEGIVSFIGATPLGTHNLIALIAEIVGISGNDVSESLSFFALIVFLIPVLVMLVSVVAISTAFKSKIQAFIAVVIVLVAVFYGYPSHIWFSGYLTSNLSTLLMLIGACVVVFGKTGSHKLFVLFSLGFAQFIVYPLYSIFATLLFLLVLASKGGGKMSEIFGEFKKHAWLLVAYSCYLFALWLVAFRALLSGYGGSQFLVIAGIEPLPIGATMLSFGLASAFLLNLEMESMNEKLLRRSTWGLIAIAISVISFAYFETNEPGKIWIVPYYPAKLAISVLIVLIVLFAIQAGQISQSQKLPPQRSLSALTILAIISTTLVLSTYNSWPFSNGFMGNTHGVVKSLSGKSREFVDGSKIEQSLKYTEGTQLSALYLSDIHEKELNTRWINSLNLNWTDDNWSAWMKSMVLIEEGNLQEAADLLNGRFILIIDNYSKFQNNPASFVMFKNICVINLIRDDKCRSI